ncbi:MAG: 3'-5' exonuclease [Rhodomicrobium sp.]
MTRLMNFMLNRLAGVLEARGNYRVLRRLEKRDRSASAIPANSFTGIILDTETTGMIPGADEVIEFGMLKFEYGQDGQVYRVLDSFNRLRQPTKPIPASITTITGITNEEVAGQIIDPADVEAFVSGAALIIAHNARFDRPMCEAAWPFFRNLNWACSCVQVPWKEEGHEGVKLGYLLNDYGRFHNGHRAIDDCHAVLHLLAQPMRRAKRPAMSALLENARKTQYQLWAENAPFDFKDVLKSRGYRWNAEARCWSVVLNEDALPGEEEYLRREVYGGRDVELRCDKLTARNRFSLAT